MLFLEWNVSISLEISLKFVPNGPISKIPPLVQIMAWHRSGDKPYSEPTMVRLLTHICGTRPQWVNYWSHWCPCMMSSPISDIHDPASPRHFNQRLPSFQPLNIDPLFPRTQWYNTNHHKFRQWVFSGQRQVTTLPKSLIDSPLDTNDTYMSNHHINMRK